MKIRSFSILISAVILISLVIATIPGVAVTASDFSGKIVFSSPDYTNGRGGAGQIFVMNPDGSGVINLSNNAFSEGHPVLSHDGTKIAFNRSTTSGYNTYVYIGVMNSDGSNPQLLPNSVTSTDSYPVWSPDDSKIAFIKRGNLDNIWIINANGSNPIQVSSITNHVMVYPSWGSNHIIAVQAEEGSSHSMGDTSHPWKIMSIADSVVNGTPVNLVADSSHNYYDPAFSPDGTRIAFTYSANIAYSHIYDVRKFMGVADVANPTTFTPLYTFSSGSHSAATPAWSPDGNYLAFVIGTDVRDWQGRVDLPQIYRIDANGTNQTLISTRSGQSPPFWDCFPNWGSEPHVTQLLVTGASICTKGDPYSFTVTAKNNFGNTFTSYGGTVHFTSTDTAGVLPGDYSFTGADNGVHSFYATLNTVGSQSITATDTVTSITGSKDVTVDKIYAFVDVTSSLNPSTAGDTVTFTATINPVPDGGTVQFYVDGADFGIPVPVNTGDGTAVSDSVDTLSVDNHGISADYSGNSNYYGNNGGVTQMVGEASEISNTIIFGGTASVSQTDGVSTTITGITADDGTSITISSVYYGNSQPAGLSSVMLNGTEYYDVQVTGVTDGIASVSISSAAVTPQTVLQYYNDGGWVDAQNNIVTGPEPGTGWYTVSGDISVSHLGGTPVAIGSKDTQIWYLDSETKLGPPPTGTDDRPDLPAGYFEMEKATGPDNDGQTGIVAVNSGSDIIWISDQQAESDVEFYGTWTVNLVTDSWKDDCSVQIGDWDGVSVFTDFNFPVIDTPDGDGVINFTIDASGTVLKGHYLALRVSNSGTGNVVTTGNSYLISPDGEPGFPLPEFPSYILLSIGLVGIGGFLLARRNRIARAMR
jgi:Tol biopolymer transport system component